MTPKKIERCVCVHVCACVCVCECVCARVRDIIVLATLPTIDQQLCHAITDLTHKKL